MEPVLTFAMEQTHFSLQISASMCLISFDNHSLWRKYEAEGGNCCITDLRTSISLCFAGIKPSSADPLIDERRRLRWSIVCPSLSSVRMRTNIRILVWSSHSDIAQLIAPRFTSLVAFSATKDSKRRQKMLLTNAELLCTGNREVRSKRLKGLLRASSTKVFNSCQADSSGSIQRELKRCSSSCLKW